MSADVVTTRLGLPSDLARLEPLWTALYVHQRENGMFLSVPADGFSLWMKSMAPILGRFGCFAIAEAGDVVVGFVAGRIRSIPAWFGGGQTGFISDVFVAPAERGRGVSRRLIELTNDWFDDHGIIRVELQVIANNKDAIDAYKHLGWQEELVQMVWARAE